jgi:anti-sigma regulatory factor (Ser/Thr protein kinase)
MHPSRTGPPTQPSPTGHRWGIERVELAPRPSSAATARQLARVVAGTHRLGDDLADALCLVVSELVTNAVLHARTELVLTLEVRPGVVRVAVRDRSPAALAVRNYPPDAVTGRGLGVVAALSRTWGMVADADGKLVWAEFDLDGTEANESATAPQTTGPPLATGAPGATVARTVRFLGVPVAAYMALQEHNDALCRELELLAIEHDSVPGPGRPSRLHALAGELLGPRFRGARDAHREAVVAAQARGEATVDLQANVSADMVPLARAYVALLDEADGYGRDGLLLTTAPHPDVTALRHWFVEQLDAQLLDGLPPTPASL